MVMAMLMDMDIDIDIDIDMGHMMIAVQQTLSLSTMLVSSASQASIEAIVIVIDRAGMNDYHDPRIVDDMDTAILSNSGMLVIKHKSGDSGTLAAHTDMIINTAAAARDESLRDNSYSHSHTDSEGSEKHQHQQQQHKEQPPEDEDENRQLLQHASLDMATASQSPTSLFASWLLSCYDRQAFNLTINRLMVCINFWCVFGVILGILMALGTTGLYVFQVNPSLLYFLSEQWYQHWSMKTQPLSVDTLFMMNTMSQATQFCPTLIQNESHSQSSRIFSCVFLYRNALEFSRNGEQGSSAETFKPKSEQGFHSYIKDFYHSVCAFKLSATVFHDILNETWLLPYQQQQQPLSASASDGDGYCDFQLIYVDLSLPRYDNLHPLHTYDLRHYIYLYHLMHMADAGQPYKFVLFTDLRDVHFGSDPFYFLNCLYEASNHSTALFLSDESGIFNGDDWYNPRFSACGQAYEHFQYKHVLNAGVFGGTHEAAVWLLSVMTRISDTMLLPAYREAFPQCLALSLDMISLSTVILNPSTFNNFSFHPRPIPYQYHVGAPLVATSKHVKPNEYYVMHRCTIAS